MKTAEIRQAFLTYFQQKNHEIVPSSSLIPSQDPTLLFTNAGMVQFKDVFLGLEKKSYQRAVSVQKCVRAGGKHNDLENVGYTARHHTFFEMLGFFSFGDYFKREAIQFAWDFLTKHLALPIEKLWVTVYEDDEEARRIWIEEIGVSPQRLSTCGDKDNFWSMGETGPCGPCTEIFYDHGPTIAGGPPGSPEADGDRYIEIWNLVFMQYNRDASGQLHPLPHPAVDTGMGLERVAAVVQGVHTNYEIDDFQLLMQAIKKLTPQPSRDRKGADISSLPLQLNKSSEQNHPSKLNKLSAPLRSRLGYSDTNPNNNANSPSIKVIADHLRSSAFLIADGVLPSNEGRGYVVRRIIRRAIRHANQLGIVSPFFAQLLPTLLQVMGEAYPELKTKQQLIAQALTKEEDQFAKTLEKGLTLLCEAMKKGASQQVLAGEVAFKLYDTYGFPVDLTEDILREHAWTLDSFGFEKCMEAQRALSQASSAFHATQSHVELNIDSSDFHGYDVLKLTTRILGFLIDGNKQENLSEGQSGSIILQATPFYAESGGQVGDKGVIQRGAARFIVTDTQKLGQVFLHQGYVESGEFSQEEEVEAIVNDKLRESIRLNHTGTHLLHAALKQILGSSVEQKGSLVEPNRARFDFSYAKALTAQELADIEHLVNKKIREDIPVVTDLMTLEEAKKTGAMALFGEKYTEKVRVLSVGEFSKELCGGTHVKRTGEIGYLKIIAEYGIASGVRRIEMITAQHALDWVTNQLTHLNDLGILLKSSPEEIKNKVLQLLSDIKEKDKQLGQLRQKIAQYSSGSLLDSVELINEVSCLVANIDGVDMSGLRVTLDSLRDKLPNAVLVLYTLSEGRMSVIVSVSQALLTRVPKAPVLAKCLCEKAGGRDDMAQGGGSIPEDLDKRIERLKDLIKFEK